MKFEKIRKRNGNYVKFDIDKIVNAILQAGTRAEEIDKYKAKKLAMKVVIIAEQVYEHIPNVKDINDTIESVLLGSKYDKTAKEFVIYKYEHEKKKEAVQDYNKSLVNNYINNEDWKVKENANMGFSIQGLNQYITAGVEKKHWLYEVYDKEIRETHERGEFHINDLSQISAYCCGWDLNEFLQLGFRGVENKVESKPPKHFSSALGQMVNFIFSIAGEVSGAVAFGNADTLLAPYIKEDNLTQEQVEQCMQEFVFNMNVATRVGFQAPFSNLSLDITTPKNFKDKPVFIGDEIKDYTYSECQNEMNMFNQALFKVMTEGDAKGRVFTFPIINISITKEFDWDNPNLSNFWDSLAKYGLPTFSNYINSDIDPEDSYSMCCRLRLDKTKLHSKGGGQFGASGLTGSVGVVTINLNRIGYEANDKKEFYKILEKRMDIAGKSLKMKRDLVEEQTEKGLYPYCAFYLKNIHKRHKRYWANHFSTIGLVGGNEACLNLLGKTIATEEGNVFMQEVLSFMNNKLIDLQEQHDCYYNLEQSPSESLSRSLALKDREYMGEDIILAGTKLNPYLTNSTQLPVNYTDDFFEVLDLQNDLAKQYTGGSVIHLWLGEQINEHSVLKNLIKTVCENYNMPYFTLTPTFSICPKHGYMFGEHKYCPLCDAEILFNGNDIDK